MSVLLGDVDFNRVADGMVDFISAMLGILLGFALVLFQNTVLVVIIGAYLIHLELGG